jgi:transcriptional regulator of acetoin/glycerol metabolism
MPNTVPTDLDEHLTPAVASLDAAMIAAAEIVPAILAESGADAWHTQEHYTKLIRALSNARWNLNELAAGR